MDTLESCSGNRTIGVVGASARAAIHSILRAGFQGWAVDLFADRDLKNLVPCSVCPTDSFPDSLPGLCELYPAGPILYTGGLENHPDIVAELTSKHQLLGNLPAVLNLVRDPFFIGSVAAEGILFPNLIPIGDCAPGSGHWLRKPLRSSSGLGIRFAKAQEPFSTSHYFQEHIDGSSMSALFASMSGKSNCTHLLGVTEQLIGRQWLHARPFAYCGNIGPVRVPAKVEVAFKKYGSELTRAAGLRGVWGLDFILNGDFPYPVEVNPRYTAAMEVLELSGKFPSIRLHLNCFNDSQVSRTDEYPDPLALPVGKAIYFAPHRIEFPLNGPWDEDLSIPFDPWRVPGFADIPEPRTIIEAGNPVLTLFAKSNSAAGCFEALLFRAAELDSLFAEAAS
jgi:predicted ATP-grasp superfamily ATP-dependent carboligase